MSDDMLAKKRARLEELKKAAADRKKKGPKAPTTRATPRGQVGQADNLNEYLDQVTSMNSAFEERKRKEVEDNTPAVQREISTNLSVALDQ